MRSNNIMQYFARAIFCCILCWKASDIGVLGFKQFQRSSMVTTTTTSSSNNNNINANSIGGFHGQNSRNHLQKKDTTVVFQQHHDYRGGAAAADDDDDDNAMPLASTENHHGILFHCAIILNASSKWLLASANLYGVIRYRDPGAFLCTGCIVACFVAEHVLKPLWNQARPLGAKLADPGMPSSHSLGSFFVAIGWAHLLRDLEGNMEDPLLLFLGISSLVASLRIICGYHTVAQVVVGALLGLFLGHGWIDWIWNRLNVKTFLYTHATVRWIIWSAYISGSLLFICKIMSKWIDRQMLLH
ncbi:unnamed protein product [Cylindrotheca closterium]|uniref:Phosphatidic acid phosphatase type 2/haloperoxidase domain-containing protein n=1 Tax=Cylindrotheca closterium TaxID=2856 RepID=A0AAD2FEI1_9STRA|nr:unnamed protein product [Cylindrotheca closterium]